MRKRCIAMLLAGGQGSRLGVLTAKMAKPAVPFGGKYRIIDFPLSNCSNSGIDTVGVLTQYMPLQLNAYLGTGRPWDLDRNDGGIYVLPPYVDGATGEWYKGTANAIYQNITFIEQYDPAYVLVLGGDHIYKMDYGAMLESHEKNGADATIAAITVPWADAPRFGILNTDEKGAILEFDEKPKAPKSNKASMGIYVFTWQKLRDYLIMDEQNPSSSNDFGNDVLPAMLSDGCAMYAYSFDGYWKDVGTIESLWESNMDLLSSPPRFDLYDTAWRIYSNISASTPHYVGPDASIDTCVICEGAQIYGSVTNSIVFGNSAVGRDTHVKGSIIMPKVTLAERAKVVRTIICEGARIGNGCVIGDESAVTVIAPGASVPDGATVPPGVQYESESGGGDGA